ncbi:hypothetical protein KCU66_g20, partial [Aureobasidium melanogenum]
MSSDWHQVLSTASKRLEKDNDHQTNTFLLTGTASRLPRLGAARSCCKSMMPSIDFNLLLVKPRILQDRNRLTTDC